ncbi:MAG: XRE family transcriptional regulator [Desulforudis sp.]|nr:MAG: XRE family transcriptional regulator [Desulforudis sp.]
MIKNDRQYRITKTQAKKLELSLQMLHAEPRETHPLLIRAQEEALTSQLDELKEELKEYKELQAGKYKFHYIFKNIEDLPENLIKARISAGLTQKELADKLGMKEQQIQRYEATDYRTASYERLINIIKALNIKLDRGILHKEDKYSIEYLLRKLKDIGIDKDFVFNRLVHPRYRFKDESLLRKDKEEDNFILQIVSSLRNIFNWSESDILSETPLELDSLASTYANFKIPEGAQKSRLSAYIVYAHYLALLVLDATSAVAKSQIPDDPLRLRESIVEQYGDEFSLKDLLKHFWELGITILPLNDPGAFHGACWRINGRNIAVLKQSTLSESRWIFDLLHEYYHLSQEQNEEQLAIIEDEPDSPERLQSDEEMYASQFAGEVILAGKAEDLAQKCVEEAHGKVEWLKKTVPIVAVREKVAIDALANYMAFRLSFQGINWWGAANNLQKTDMAPWAIARDFLLERLDFKKLNEMDQNLLIRALTD